LTIACGEEPSPLHRRRDVYETFNFRFGFFAATTATSTAARASSDPALEVAQRKRRVAERPDHRPQIESRVLFLQLSQVNERRARIHRDRDESNANPNHERCIFYLARLSFEFRVR